jgi:hypothetical protein
MVCLEIENRWEKKSNFFSTKFHKLSNNSSFFKRLYERLLKKNTFLNENTTKLLKVEQVYAGKVKLFHWCFTKLIFYVSCSVKNLLVCFDSNYLRQPNTNHNCQSMIFHRQSIIEKALVHFGYRIPWVDEHPFMHPCDSIRMRTTYGHA